MDESISRFLVENYRTYRKHHDSGHCAVHRIQERDRNRVRPVSNAARIHPDRRNSLRAHFRIFLGANAGYCGGKVDIRLSPSLRIPKILASIFGGKMPCGFCLINSHFSCIASSSRCSFIAVFQGWNPTRSHASVGFLVRSRSHREYPCFDGTWILVGSIRDFRVEIRVGSSHLCLRVTDGLLRGPLPCYSSPSSIFRCGQCSAVYRVYPRVSRCPSSIGEHFLVPLLSRSEFRWRADLAGPRTFRIQVRRKESEKTGSTRPQSSVTPLN